MCCIRIAIILFILASLPYSHSISFGLISSTCNYCMSKICNPTITPAETFNVKEDRQRLETAVKRWGSAQDTLISILTERSEQQRLQLYEEYIKTGNTLTDIVARDKNNKYLEVLVALTKPLPMFYAEELHDALLSDDYEALFEILSSLPGCAIREILVLYRIMYKISFYDQSYSVFQIWSEYQNLLLELAKGDRDEDEAVNIHQANKDAQDLDKARKGSFNSKFTTFKDILTKRSYPQLKATLEVYESLRKTDESYESIFEDIRNTFYNKVQYGFLSIVRNAFSQTAFFTRELEVSLMAFVMELDKRKVIRIIRGRSELDLADIKREFQAKYKVALTKRITKQTDPPFDKALLAVLKQ